MFICDTSILLLTSYLSEVKIYAKSLYVCNASICVCMCVEKVNFLRGGVMLSCNLFSCFQTTTPSPSVYICIAKTLEVLNPDSFHREIEENLESAAKLGSREAAYMLWMQTYHDRNAKVIIMHMVPKLQLVVFGGIKNTSYFTGLYRS